MTTLNFQTSKKRIAVSEYHSSLSLLNLRHTIIPVISMAKNTASHDDGIVNDFMINQLVTGKFSHLQADCLYTLYRILIFIYLLQIEQGTHNSFTSKRLTPKMRVSL